MKILVTGGAGFIGSNLIHFLMKETAHRIINVDKLTYAASLSSLAEFTTDRRLEFERVDIEDPARVRRLFEDHKPNWVMHLAAESHVDRSIENPARFIQTNTVGTFNLLNASRTYFDGLDRVKRSEFRFHHVSTDEVFGSLDIGQAGFTESSPYDPHSPYSASKAASDHLVRAWGATYGLPFMITHCSNNYGPYQFPEKLIPLVILKAIHGQPIPVYGRGENIRDWIFVNDHVQALYAVLTRGSIGETYNVGGNQECTNIELVHHVCEILDEIHPPSENPRLAAKAQQAIASYSNLITFVKDRPGHDLRYAIDATKITAKLGWRPQEDLESGLRKTIHWYLENTRWWQTIQSVDHQNHPDKKVSGNPN